MTRLKSILALISILFVGSVYSTTITKEYQVQFKQAMLHIQNDEYKDAYPLLSAMNQVNNNSNLDFHMGLCSFYLQFDKSNALAFFDKAANNIAKKYVNTAESTQAPNEVVYFQGLCYHYLGQTEKAIASYEKYLSNSKTMSSDKLIIADAKRKLTIAKEQPALFSKSENEQIEKNRVNDKKIDGTYKAKLQKVMNIINEDKIEALLILKEMLKEYPNEPNINYMMGVCMLNMKTYNDLATNYFVVADKNASKFKDCGIGLDCPAFVKYYSGIANQVKGDHKQALADFEAFNAVYPQEYNSLKPEFIKRMEYSRNMLTTTGTNNNLANYKNSLDIIDTAGLQIIFPVIGTPIAIDNSNSGNSSNQTGEYTYYYSVQVGAGNMDEKYFDKVTELRIATYPSGMKRFVTGKFANKAEANIRMKELIDLGYTDAFSLRMRGKK